MSWVERSWDEAVNKASTDLVALADKHRYAGEQLSMLADRLPEMFDSESSDERLLVFAVKSILDAMAEGEAKIANSLEEEIAC